MIDQIFTEWPVTHANVNFPLTITLAYGRNLMLLTNTIFFYNPHCLQTPDLPTILNVAITPCGIAGAAMCLGGLGLMPIDPSGQSVAIAAGIPADYITQAFTLLGQV